MTLALAQSFIDSNGEYGHSLSIQYYLDWFNHGRFSTTNKAWDLGRSTRVALRIWKAHGLDELALTQLKVREKLDQEESSGNGSLMRIAPIGVALWKDRGRAKRLARYQSLVTHPALACLDACQAYTELICMVMSGMSPRSQLIPPLHQTLANSSIGHTKEDLCKTIGGFKFAHPALVSRFSRYTSIADWKAKSSADMTSSGWVVDTLEAALWGFFKYDSWEEGALAVVNLGGDSDTAGAVYGGLAGVFYGYEAIPSRWVNGMQNRGLISDIAGRFARVVPLV